MVGSGTASGSVPAPGAPSSATDARVVVAPLPPRMAAAAWSLPSGAIVEGWPAWFAAGVFLSFPRGSEDAAGGELCAAPAARPVVTCCAAVFAVTGTLGRSQPSKGARSFLGIFLRMVSVAAARAKEEVLRKDHERWLNRSGSDISFEDFKKIQEAPFFSENTGVVGANRSASQTGETPAQAPADRSRNDR